MTTVPSLSRLHCLLASQVYHYSKFTAVRPHVGTVILHTLLHAEPMSFVQVIDARDPLTYRSDDLEQYARDIAPHKGSLLLLNKADLLSAELRTAWADYFDERGVSYVFWSAKAAADALKQDAGGSLDVMHRCCSSAFVSSPA